MFAKRRAFSSYRAWCACFLESYLKTGKVRFIVQATIHEDEPSRILRSALKELEEYSSDHVELVGREGFMAPAEYYDLLANSDVVLCPYGVSAYRARSSGIVAEAIMAGKPTVVPAGTWLAAQQWPGSGETFTDETSLAEAVRSVFDNYPEYRERAQSARSRWQQFHSPAHLVNCLLGLKILSRASAA